MSRYPVGRRTVYHTWFALWMDVRGLTIHRLMNLLQVAPSSIVKWRKGRPMRRHMATLIRALYPEAPINRGGGPVPRLQDRLPIHARTPQLYRFLMKRLGFIQKTETPEQIWPVALEEARLTLRKKKEFQNTIISEADRRFIDRLKAGQSTILPGQPNANGIANVFPPADESGK